MISDYVLSIEPIYSLLIISALVSLAISLIYRFFGNYKEMKRIKLELNDLKEPLSKARKEKNEKKILELMKKQNELAMEQFRFMAKPLILTFLVVVPTLGFIRHIYTPLDLIFVLPFPLPFAGKDVTWLGFYIIMSLPLTVLFRKLLKLD